MARRKGSGNKRNAPRRRLPRHTPPTTPKATPRPLIRSLAMIATSLYVVVVIVVPQKLPFPDLFAHWQRPRAFVYDVIQSIYAWVGFANPATLLQNFTFFFVVALVVPWVVMALLQRGRPHDIGWRKPNPLLLRLVGCSFLVALPFLYWMVSHPNFYKFYERRYSDTSMISVALYYVWVLFCEHLFFEGIMLGAFRKGGRWPAPAGICKKETSGFLRVLRWMGMAQPTGEAKGVQRVTRWLGLPDGCLGAVLLSGLLFGMVHAGKNQRELLLSFPGGTFLAYLAYRCNSWHAPYLLHASTVLAAGAMMFLLNL